MTYGSIKSYQHPTCSTFGLTLNSHFQLRSALLEFKGGVMRPLKRRALLCSVSLARGFANLDVYLKPPHPLR